MGFMQVLHHFIDGAPHRQRDDHTGHGQCLLGRHSGTDAPPSWDEPWPSHMPHMSSH